MTFNRTAWYIAHMNIISWNFTNWMTVFLMALVGFIAVRLVLDAAARLGGQNAES